VEAAIGSLAEPTLIALRSGLQIVGSGRHDTIYGVSWIDSYQALNAYKAVRISQHRSDGDLR
jgi:hypothetical protein